MKALAIECFSVDVNFPLLQFVEIADLEQLRMENPNSFSNRPK